MAVLHTAFHIIRKILGLGSYHNETIDWLKLALAVAARPEDEESKRIVHVALESSNQEFLGLLRAALETRVAAAARLAAIESDNIECRAFLPGSPALWGWSTDVVAESVILKAGIDTAIHGSIFDPSPASSSQTSEDVFVGLGSKGPMGGATLRDIYAKAWELHREPLVWTPQGPGAGVGASTWTLAPASLTSRCSKRSRSVSDASGSRSPFIEQPFLSTPTPTRPENLQEIFEAIGPKTDTKSSPRIETDVAVLASHSPSTPALEASLEPLTSRRPRRSTSCTRSHVSSTTALTVSECSTTQELPGLGHSFDRSAPSRFSTRSDHWFTNSEPGSKSTKRDKMMVTGSTTNPDPRPGNIASRCTKDSDSSSLTRSLKHLKTSQTIRPSNSFVRRPQASVPKGTNRLDNATFSAKPLRDTLFHSSQYNDSAKLHGKSQEPFSLRRVRSVATVTPSPSPQSSKATSSNPPIIVPVPVGRHISNKHDPTEPSRTVDGVSQQDEQRKTRSSHSTPAPKSTQRAASGQSRIPRPVSRAEPVPFADSAVSNTLRTPKREPPQPLTPVSNPRIRGHTSLPQAPRSGAAANPTRPRTVASSQERAAFTRDVRPSRPTSRAHPTTRTNDPSRHSPRRHSIAIVD